MWPTPPTPDKKTFEIAGRLSRIEHSKDIEVFGLQVIEIMEAATGAAAERHGSDRQRGRWAVNHIARLTADLTAA